MARLNAFLAPICACLLAACSQPKDQASAKKEAPAAEAPPKAATKKGPEKPPEAAANVPAQSGDCSPVLNTLTTKQPEVELSLEVSGTKRPLEFKADAVYPSNRVWDASDAPSLCAAVLQPPQVERPALNLVAQLEAEGKPIMRLQAMEVEMGERDLAAEGPGVLTAFIIEKDKVESVHFNSGKLVLERVEEVKSRVTMRFVGASGVFAPEGESVVLNGSITATVGGR